MAKKKKDVDSVDMDELYQMVAQASGGDILDELESVNYYVDTGNLAANYSCSGKFIPGGIPGGRITEAYGPESSGKSLIGNNLLFGVQKIGGWAILLDCENASNAEFMRTVSHLNLKHVVRHAPPTLERAFRTIHVTVRKIREVEAQKGLPRTPILVMFDSLTVPPCERELKENDLPLDYTVTDWKKVVGRKEQPGERAKVISAEMRKLQSMAVKQDVTIYLINQTRDKIGVLYGSPETVPGGNAVKFYASCRIRTQAKKKIENTKLGKFSGINLQVKNVKNKTFRPYVVAEDVKLFFEEGVDPLSGLLNCLIESERVVMKGAGNYVVNPAYLPDDFAEYKFKAVKAENRVKAQVLLDCPKLVDGTREDVEKYLEVWGSGLAASESGNYQEKSVGFDADGDPIEQEEE